MLVLVMVAMLLVILTMIGIGVFCADASDGGHDKDCDRVAKTEKDGSTDSSLIASVRH